MELEHCPCGRIARWRKDVVRCDDCVPLTRQRWEEIELPDVVDRALTRSQLATDNVVALPLPVTSGPTLKCSCSVCGEVIGGPEECYGCGGCASIWHARHGAAAHGCDQRNRPVVREV